MDEPVDVLFALTGDVRRNSRALRQLDVLTGMGCSVKVLTFGPEAKEPWRGLRLRALPQPPGGGPAFFRSVDRIFRSAARETRARVYHASDLFVLPALHAAARANGGRLVYDSRELYPHVGATAGKPWARAFWYLIERRHIRHADAVFTVSRPIAEWIARRYQVPEPVLVYNVPPYRPVARTNLLRERLGIPAELPIVLYQGFLKRGRGCEPLVEAIGAVDGAVLVFVGEGDLEASLRARARQHGLEARVRFTGMVPPDELLPLTASADVGACLIEDLSLSLRYAMPNKLFEYLMAGLPVLGSDLPEIRRVVETGGVGCIVDPADHGALVRTLKEMTGDAEARRRWSANTPRVFESYSWEASAERFREVYRRLLA